MKILMGSFAPRSQRGHLVWRERAVIGDNRALIRFDVRSPARYAPFDVTLRDVRRRSTVTGLTLKSARCSQRRCTITKCPSARLLQLQAGQWDCALLHARYTPDRTGYGQTVDIWSWKPTPGLSPTFRIPAAHAEAQDDLEARPVDYQTKRLTPKEKERTPLVPSTRQKTTISDVGAMSMHACARRWNSHFLECQSPFALHLHRIYSKIYVFWPYGLDSDTPLHITIKKTSPSNTMMPEICRGSSSCSCVCLRWCRFFSLS